jgi:cell division protein FtsB
MHREMRKEFEQWRQCQAKRDEELQAALQVRLDELQQQQSKLQAAYEDKLRSLVAENARLRAECARLHEARGLLDFIKTQCASDRSPDTGIQRSAD